MNMRSSSNTIRIFNIDDHEIVFEGLKRLLSRENDLNVCGFAKNANDAIEEIDHKKPDLIITDISIGGKFDGIELIKKINNKNPLLPILILSMYDENLYAERAIKAGARGYIMKHEMTNVILKAIRSIMKGKIFINRKIESRLQLNKTRKMRAPVKWITRPELELFRLIGGENHANKMTQKFSPGKWIISRYRLYIKNKIFSFK